MSRHTIKPTKWHVHPAKTQISPVESESSLPSWRNIGPLTTNWVHREDSDQTGRMPKLIWVFAGHTVILFVLSWGGSLMIKKMDLILDFLFLLHIVTSSTDLQNILWKKKVFCKDVYPLGPSHISKEENIKVLLNEWDFRAQYTCQLSSRFNLGLSRWKSMVVFEGNALFFCGGGWGWLFSNPVGGCLFENVILYMVVLLQNAVLWVSFIQMGSCGLLRFNYKEKWEKTIPVL